MNLNKLIIITNMPSPYQVDFFNALAKKIDLKIIYAKLTEPNRKWEYEKNIKHESIFLKGPFHKKIPKLRKIFKEDAVFIVSGYNLPEFIYSMQYLTSNKIPWLFWGERIRLKNVWLKKLLIMKLLRRAKAILGIGEMASRLYYELTGAPTFVFPYHIDTSKFTKSDYFLNGRINFVYSGQLITRKGIKHLIKAFNLVNKKYSDKIFLHIIGDGPLRQYVKKNTEKYHSTVKLYGFVKYEDLYRIYEKGDVFLFPSLYDGWGVAIAEAMASGMIPIATFTTGATMDLVLHGFNGFLIPPENTLSLTYYMNYLIENKHLIVKMGQNAAEYIKEYNDIEKGVLKLLNILSQIEQGGSLTTPSK